MKKHKKLELLYATELLQLDPILKGKMTNSCKIALNKKQKNGSLVYEIIK